MRVSRLAILAALWAGPALAILRRDGRVTEVTSNWNLYIEGLTRLRVSCRPLREHTRNLMQVEMM